MLAITYMRIISPKHKSSLDIHTNDFIASFSYLAMKVALPILQVTIAVVENWEQRS